VSGSQPVPRGPEALHELRELLSRLQPSVGRWLGALSDRARLELRRAFASAAIELVLLACVGALVVRGVILVADGALELLAASGGWLSPGIAKLLVGGGLAGLVFGLWFILSRRLERRARAAARRRRELAAEDVGKILRAAESAAIRSLDVTAWARAHPLGSTATAAALGAMAGSRLGGAEQRRRPPERDESGRSPVDDGRVHPEPRRAAASSALLTAILPVALHVLDEWFPGPSAVGPPPEERRVNGQGARARG
jgi:hypothetical protein